jgi:hypothetical protein
MPGATMSTYKEDLLVDCMVMLQEDADRYTRHAQQAITKEAKDLYTRRAVARRDMIASLKEQYQVGKSS